MAELIYLCIGLALVATFGHFVWISIAWLIRQVFGGRSSDDVTSIAAAVREATRPTLHGDLDAFRRIIAYLRYLGQLSEGDESRLRGWGETIEEVLRRGEAAVGKQGVPVVKQGAPAVSEPPVTAQLVAPARQPTAPVTEERAVSATLVPNPPITNPLVISDPITQTTVPSSKRAMADVLRSFMASNNIRWGELAAGILIVVCSIGLVVSLWNTMTQTHRLLPASVFLTAVTMIEGAGLYTLRRWRLRHTSLAVLIIATMLVPLSMMAGISIAGRGAGAVSLSEPLTWLAIVAGGVWCLGLYYFSGVALVQRGALRSWMLSLGSATLMLPLTPAIVRSLQTDSCWALAGAAFLVGLAIAMHSRQRCRLGVWRGLLPARRKRIVLANTLSLYSLAILGAMYWLTQRNVLEDPTSRITPLLLAVLPVLIAAAGSFTVLRQRTATGPMRVVGGGAASLAVGGVLVLFPASLEQFSWVQMWAGGLIGSACVIGWVMRQGWLFTLAPVALAMFVPLATSVYWNGEAWSTDSPLWQRYVHGPGAVALVGVTLASLGAWRLTGLTAVRWPLAWGAAVSGAAALLVTLAVGLGTEVWLLDVPRGVIVVFLACFTAVPALLPVTGTGRRVWFAITENWLAIISTLLALATGTSALLWYEVWTTTAAIEVLMRCAVVLLGAATGLGLLGELRWRMRASQFAVTTRWVASSWWTNSAVLAVLGGLLSLPIYEDREWTGIAIGAGATLLLLVGACRGGMSLAFTAGQGISGLVWLMSAYTLFPETFARDRWGEVSPWMLTIALSASYATLWEWLRLFAGNGWHRVRELLERDHLRWERAVAVLSTVGFVLLVTGLLLRVCGGYLQRELFDLPGGKETAITGLVLIAMYLLQGVFVARSSRGQGNDTSDREVTWLSIHERRPLMGLMVTVTALATCVGLYLCGTESRGLYAVGWFVVLANLGSGAVGWRVGRSGTFAVQRYVAVSVVMAWCLGMSMLAGSLSTLLAGPHGFIETNRLWNDWLVWGCAGMLGTTAAMWSVASRITGQRLAANVAVALIPLTLVILSRLIFTNDVGWHMLAAAVAGTLLSDTLRRVSEASRAFDWLDNFRWQPQSVLATNSSTAKTEVHPAWELARVGLGVLFAVAIAQTFANVFDLNWQIQPPRAWTLLTFVGGAICALHYGSKMPMPAAARALLAAAGTLAVGAGWLSTLAVDEGWIRPVLLGATLAGGWLLSGLMAFAVGVVYRQLSGFVLASGLSLAGAFYMLAITRLTSMEAWVALGCCLLGSGSALGIAKLAKSETKGGFVGQSLAVLFGIASVALSMRWILDDLVAASVSVAVLSGSVVAWRLVIRQRTTWIDQVLAGGALAMSVPVLSLFLQAIAAEPASRLNIVFGYTLLGLAGIALTFPLRVSSVGSLSLAFIASQIFSLIVVLRVSGDRWVEAKYAIASVVIAFISGVWVWGWPMLRQAVQRRPTAELRGVVASVGVLLVIVAAGGLLDGVSAVAAWLAICAVGGMSAIVGIASGWSFTAGEDERAGSRVLRHLSVIYFVAAMSLGGFRLDIDQTPWGLQVAMRLLVAGVAIVPLLAWVLPRSLKLDMANWQRPLRLGMGYGAVLALGAGAIMFGLEYEWRGDLRLLELPLPLVLGISCVLGVGSALCAVVGLMPAMVARVVPQVSESQRRWLLYSAQVLGGLAWLHLYFCRPQLAFVGLRPYWPYTVMLLAFASAALTEWGRRRGDQVVAKTLRQSALYLPLIPVIGFWMTADNALWTFAGERVPYLALLALGTIFYGALAVLWSHDRQPRAVGVVLGNLTLWVLLAQYPGFSFAQHPQFWLIPPAVCVLVATHVERRHLQPSLQTAIRYGATLVIYVSSSADIVLGEVGKTLWGPIALVILALIGMMAGVVLRTRSFLYLGTFFVLIGVLSMVWHAQRAIDQSWPWWVFGITMGVMILAGLMAAEKQKAKLRLWADRLSGWEA